MAGRGDLLRADWVALGLEGGVKAVVRKINRELFPKRMYWC